MSAPVRRALLILLLILGLVPTWHYETRPRQSPDGWLSITRLAQPAQEDVARDLRPFALEGVWEIKGRFAGYGGYSALLALPDGRLMAISDDGLPLTFSPPGSRRSRPPGIGRLPPSAGRRTGHDFEAAVRDPATGTIWLSREYENAISRHDPGLRSTAIVAPRAMADWGNNSGPEAMTRLSDGRFIVLREGFDGVLSSRRHQALLFPRDPLLGDRPIRFTFEGAAWFSPTDMAVLPDGRALILMRRLIWPFPLRFAGRIMIADPRRIRRGAVWRAREVARLTTSLPVDNFEGMAIVPRADGRVTVWLISDDNHAVTQRTLLWKLVVDPKRLP